MKTDFIHYCHLMLIKAAATSIILISATACMQVKEEHADPADLVSTLMGTDSEYLLSHGNTYPAVALPFGMNFWTPQTRKNGDGWGYTYDDHRITGIKQTHQPSPWINDYAAFSLMPVTGINRLTVVEGPQLVLLTGRRSGQAAYIHVHGTRSGVIQHPGPCRWRGGSARQGYVAELLVAQHS